MRNACLVFIMVYNTRYTNQFSIYIYFQKLKYSNIRKEKLFAKCWTHLKSIATHLSDNASIRQWTTYFCLDSIYVYFKNLKYSIVVKFFEFFERKDCLDATRIHRYPSTRQCEYSSVCTFAFWSNLKILNIQSSSSFSSIEKKDCLDATRIHLCDNASIRQWTIHFCFDLRLI